MIRRLRPRRPLSLRRHSQRFGVSLLIALATSALVVAGLLNNTFEPLQLQASDRFFKGKPVERTSRTVIVAVDEKTVAALRDQGRFFGWPRSLHAKVLTNLAAAKPRIVVLDILFDSKSPEDAELARAMKILSSDPRSGIVQPILGNVPTRAPDDTPPAFVELLQPQPDLLAAAPAVGHANAYPDDDGTVRRVPLAVQIDGTRYPAVPLIAAAMYLRNPKALNDTIQTPSASGVVPFLGRRLPVDESHLMYINWLGPPSETGDPAAPVPQISYVDVLNGTFDPAAVSGKLVFIGVTATGFADDYWVPTARISKMDGVEIHAHAAETILGKPGNQAGGGDIDAGLFSRAPNGVTIATIVAAALLIALVVYALSPVLAAGAGVLAILLYLFAAQVFFTQGVLLNFIGPPLVLILAFAALMINRIGFEQREQRVLRGLFASYVPADIVQELANDPEQMRRGMGGERREISVLFCDLRGFTSFSETLEPEKLAEIINQYLTAMTRVIFDHRGTVDKYIGDAVMAFWNAPSQVPEHATMACRAALKMQEELKLLSARLEEQGMPPLRQRVGINTGIAAVGNMGSDLRVAYTALGDTVNLGARLEPLNNEYGTGICISEFTLRAVGEERLLVRFLDMVAVKGKTEPVGVYELLAERPLNGLLDAATTSMLEHYAEGMRQYRQRDFVAAEVAFSRAVAAKPDDGPSRLFLERSRELIVEPPSAAWDGVFIMTRK